MGVPGALERNSDISAKQVSLGGCRYPYLTGSRKGKALMETVKQADLAGLGARLTQGLSEAAGWKVPTLLLTGDSDKYVKVSGGGCFCSPSFLTYTHTHKWTQ